LRLYTHDGLTFLLCIVLFLSCENGNEGKDSGAREINSGSSEKAGLPIRVPVRASGFLYHRFDEKKYPSTSISASLFEDHLNYLIKNAIPVITLGQLFQIRDSVDKSQKYVIITIDDAFDSFYQFGYPLLKKYGLKATLFVNSETVGSGDYLNWDQLKELHEYGIEIGNHTHSHAYFLNEPPAERTGIFLKDVAMAQELIKEHIRHTCTVFAYPYGEYDEDMQKTVRDLGFQGAAAQNSGVISEYSDPFALPRFPMTDTYGRMPAFIEKVRMNPLPVIEILPNHALPEKNPPVLKILFRNIGFDMDRLQCFIQGGESRVQVVEGDSIMVEITSLKKLENRRHLYTLTVPHKTTNEWYWFSHQWVFPDRP